MNLQQACTELNIDYNAMLNRFGGSETIYIRFLKKFLDDNTYYELEKSWQNKNYSEIEINAHTLKGLSGNLGLDTLFAISNDLVQKIRKKEYKETPKIYEDLQNEYQNTREIIININ